MAAVGLEVLRPVQPMLASTATDVAAAIAALGPVLGRVEAGRRPDPGAPVRRRGPAVHPQPERRDGALAGCGRRRGRPAGRAVRARRRGAGRGRRPAPRALPGHHEPVRPSRPAPGRDLTVVVVRLPPRRRARPDRPPAPRAGRRPRHGWPGAHGCPASSPPIPARPPPSSPPRWPPATRGSWSRRRRPGTRPAAGARRGGRSSRCCTLDLVVLAAEWGHGRRRGWLSNLHLGARHPEGGWVMVGKTFKGLTDETLTLADRRPPRAGGGPARDRRRGPARAGRRGRARRGPGGRAAIPGGVALRFARVRRYRPDKSPDRGRRHRRRPGGARRPPRGGVSGGHYGGSPGGEAGHEAGRRAQRGSGRSISSRARVGQAATARRAWASRPGGNRAGVDDGVAPVVEGDALGQQLGAQPVALAGDGVDHDPPAHRQPPWPPGPAGAAGRLGRHGPRCRWRAISLGEDGEAALDEAGRPVGVLAGAPAGDHAEPALQVPLGPTVDVTAATSASMAAAMASSPCTQGPHWPALWPASHRATRALSANPQTAGRQGDQHAAPEGGAGRPQRRGAESTRATACARDPGPEVAADQHRAGLARTEPPASRTAASGTPSGTS